MQRKEKRKMYWGWIEVILKTQKKSPGGGGGGGDPVGRGGDPVRWM